MKNKKAFVGQANGERFYAKEVKKRKRFLVEYEDGSVEEYDNGILFSLELRESQARMKSMHCNTKQYMDIYVQALAHVVMGMLENEEQLGEMFSE